MTSVVMTQLFEKQLTPVAGYARVALEQGIDSSPSGLTYAVPETIQNLREGDRVTVPLGKKNKSVSGYVVDLAQGDDAHTNPPPWVAAVTRPGPTRSGFAIKTILARDPMGISLTPDLVTLAKWISGYYCCPLGMVFATMLPAAVKRGTGRVTQTRIRLSSPPGQPAVPPKITKLERSVLDVAQQLTEADNRWFEIKQLAEAAGARTVRPVKQLINKGLLIAQQHTLWPGDPSGLPRSQTPSAADGDLPLTDDQRRAIDQLVDKLHRGFSVHLLHGVTGSGKTRVYLSVIEQMFKAHGGQLSGQEGPGAVILVPEIALTDQTVTQFSDRFDGVAALHSGLTASQRHEQWRRIRSGQAKIVIGARSAIFAPLPNIGMVIVDEEHDSSYKQDQLPRYHGRDVAIRRGQILNVPVVLGSATPSLESYFNATRRHPNTDTAPSRRSYHLLRLPRRVAGLKLPDVQIIDMKQDRRSRHPGGVHLLSQRLEQTLGQTLAARGQAMLLLNRRGYANYIACPDRRCGWLMNCDYCDAMMVYHKQPDLPTAGVLRCHHCRAEQILPGCCPLCEKKITVFGTGTQRVEEEIEKKFPGIRLLRMDSDSMRTGRDYRQSLEAFGDGQLDVLVGTQMIAKGLDFPNVRLVGVICADTSLHIPDFRASERTFQLIAQVAGRAGRGDPRLLGTVIVQTFNPDDPSIILASRHDYDTFARRELDLRRQVGLPPWSRMVRIVVRDQDHGACEQRAFDLTESLAKYITQLGKGTGAVHLRGPTTCPIARIAGFHRQQIELVATEAEAAATVQKLLTALRNARLVRSDLHTAVDVDPVVLL